MKLSSKTLLRISAVGIVVPVVFQLMIKILPHIIDDFYKWYYLWRDAIGQSMMVIVLVTIALALIAIYKQRNAMPTPDKRFRIMTYVTAGLLLFGLIIGMETFPIDVWGGYVLYIPLWMRCIEVTALFVWLWMLSNRTGEETLAKPVTIITLCSGIMIVLFLVLMMIATIYVLIHGNVYGFHTYLIYHWIKTLVPVFVIGSYALSIRRASKKHHKENQ